MTITIMEGLFNDGYLYMVSKDEQFKKAWEQNGVRTSRSLLFTNMTEISHWANNELGEECLFETE